MIHPGFACQVDVYRLVTLGTIEEEFHTKMDKGMQQVKNNGSQDMENVFD